MKEDVFIPDHGQAPCGERDEAADVQVAPLADGWVEWNGGENPIPGTTVEWRNGSDDGATCLADELSGWNWHGHPELHPWRIVAYRVVEASQ